MFHMPFSAIGRSDEHPYDSSKCVIMVVFLVVIQLISLISVVFYEYRRGSISVFMGDFVGNVRYSTYTYYRYD